MVSTWPILDVKINTKYFIEYFEDIGINQNSNLSFFTCDLLSSN